MQEAVSQSEYHQKYKSHQIQLQMYFYTVAKCAALDQSTSGQHVAVQRVVIIFTVSMKIKVEMNENTVN
ncbi:hypothetical protein T01_9107 [Trichinella spiralis]|uniref:Uncharacterized protein n=1 Tax=Trichinella spiralis TaxID=6334 RepID=A0A0V1BW29_TRISP|nr:hypothetical protein T01_9107 [Trichinella spiralis]